MRKARDRCILGVVAALAAVLILPVATVQATLTVATFADPSNDASNPLFTVNWTNKTVDGGWADSKTNLYLQIPIANTSFVDAWFAMDQLTITATTNLFGQTIGQTGAGKIRFYADGTTANPVLIIDFASAIVLYNAFGGSDFSADNVRLSGSAIPPALSDEQFSFSFANGRQLPNATGFTSTASFTSSAIPEPATMVLLGLGGFALLRRKIG